ncbi:MAG: hypothetical protein LBD48_07425 [Treponema sp.]|jgi:hypothetical protein|nr:hypothetical protein [Treponema sp.]
MTIKNRTSARGVLAALKLAGMAAALSFIMTLVLTGCPVEPDPESGRAAPVSLLELPNHINSLPQNTAVNPHTVKLDMVNITTNSVMTLVNQAITNRYVIVDLSACYATNNTISSSSSG